MSNYTPIIIALLMLVAIWGFYLFPSLGSRRTEAPLASAERFDQWTHIMSDVQRRPPATRAARDSVRIRRRRTLLTLIGLSVVTLVLAGALRSFNWLMASLAVDAVLAWFVGMLLQVKQREVAQAANRHLATRPNDADAPQIRVIAGR